MANNDAERLEERWAKALEKEGMPIGGGEGRCPYTDKPCLDFACAECEVEAQEERWSEELQGKTDTDAVWQKRIEAIKKEIDGKSECHTDGEFYINVRDALRIIDKHTKGDGK